MDQDEEPDDTMRERAGTSRRKLRLFIEADRLLVVALLLAAVFVSLVALGALRPNAVVRLGSGDPIETTFQAFIGATITGVTLVLTLNQLVLSQELGAVGDQRERMEEAMQFRRDVEDRIDAPISPPEPAAFIRSLIDVVGDRARTLQDSVEENTDDATADRLDSLAANVEGNADAVSDRLGSAQFGTFEVLSAALDFNYSWKIYAARRILAENADALADEQVDALEELIETLELFGPTREHFKTLYFQWELVDLSRSILGAAIPALLVSTFMVLYYEPTLVTGTVLGVPVPSVLVAAAVAVSLLPFAVLLAYILRIATVAKRTLSIGPFTLRRTDRERDIDWDSPGD